MLINIIFEKKKKEKLVQGLDCQYIRNLRNFNLLDLA